MKKIFTIIIILAFSLNLFTQSNARVSPLHSKREPSWVYVGDAKRAIARGDIAYALDTLNKTIMNYPDNADAYYLLGLIYEKEAGNPATQGGATVYRLAVSEYKKALNYSSNFTVPAYKLDCYFNLLYIYEKLIDETNYAQTEKEINTLAEETYNLKEQGRIYFRLAEHYAGRNRDVTALEYYRKSYEDGYRQKLSLFRMSLLYRKMRNYVKEKETLTLANKYNFEYDEPSNFDVQKAITQRLEELINIKIPRRFY